MLDLPSMAENIKSQTSSVEMGSAPRHQQDFVPCRLSRISLPRLNEWISQLGGSACQNRECKAESVPDDIRYPIKGIKKSLLEVFRLD